MASPIPGTDNYEVALIAAAVHYADKFAEEYQEVEKYEGMIQTSPTNDWFAAFKDGHDKIKKISRGEVFVYVDDED